MCGRYILRQIALAERIFGLERNLWSFKASYNIAPTVPVPVVRTSSGVREGVMMRWGLIPYWCHGEPPKFSAINATIEKLTINAAWRDPWERGRRCIVVADGFYEWHVTADGRKQPFLIELADQPVFGFAGLWDRSVRADGTAIESCTLITLPANTLMAEIHNAKKRMPAILAAPDHAAWLSGTAAQAQATLRAYPDDAMHAYRVGPRVNTPKNDDAGLIEPLREPSSEPQSGTLDFGEDPACRATKS
jgi:putative SOS response-associated peptidase YedK